MPEIDLCSKLVALQTHLEFALAGLRSHGYQLVPRSARLRHVEGALRFYTIPVPPLARDRPRVSEKDAQCRRHRQLAGGAARWLGRPAAAGVVAPGAGALALCSATPTHFHLARVCCFLACLLRHLALADCLALSPRKHCVCLSCFIEAVLPAFVSLFRVILPLGCASLLDFSMLLQKW